MARAYRCDQCGKYCDEIFAPEPVCTDKDLHVHIVFRSGAEGYTIEKDLCFDCGRKALTKFNSSVKTTIKDANEAANRGE